MRGKAVGFALIIILAYLVPVLGVAPPAVYFRGDDFAWLTWAATHGPPDAFRTEPQKIPFGHYRPTYMLYWILGYRILGTGSAVPWVLCNALFFAAGLVVLAAWGNRIDSARRIAGYLACAVWFSAFLPLTYFLLNVFNAGKAITCLFLPVAVWAWLGFYARPNRVRLCLIAGISTAVCILARESAALIIPSAVAAYVMVDRHERQKPILGLLAVALAGISAAALGLLVFSPEAAGLGRRMLQELREGSLLRNLEYYTGALLWNGPRRYLWGLLVLAAAGYRRRHLPLLLALLALATGGLPWPFSRYVLLAAVLLLWARIGTKTGLALLVWFLGAFAVPLLLKHPTESYLLEASLPLSLFFGLALSEPVAVYLLRVRGSARWATLRRPIRAAMIAAPLALLGIGVVIVGHRAYGRELLPYKVHGQQFKRANEFMISSLPRGASVYVLDTASAYKPGMAEYIRKYRRFFVPRPECWFTAFGRPDMRVFTMRDSAPSGVAPSFLFASNPYEKAYCLERDPSLGPFLVYENPGCAVWDLGAYTTGETAGREEGAPGGRPGS